MCSSRLKYLSRILMVACAVGLSASTLSAQSSADSSSSSGSSTSPSPSTSTSPSSSSSAKAASTSGSSASKIDIFLGYSYLAPHGSVTIPYGSNIGVNGPVSYSAINEGAIGSVSYFFDRYVGAQVEFASHPDGNNDGATTAAGGLVFRYPTQDIVPFVHADVGAVRLGGPYHQPYTWGNELNIGGGMDYNLPFMNGRFGLRLFQADYQYMHVNFGPQAPFPEGGRANLNNARLSAGLLVHMGSIVPPPPVAYSCSLNPDSVYPGDPVTITGTATNLNPKRTVTYSWTGSNGVTVKSNNSATGQIDTSSLQPGTYTITGHVSEGQKPGQFADCNATLTVKQFEPPTLSCSANPTTVQPGGTATVTAQGVSPQNRPLTYNYSASSGQISGTGSTATLNTAGAPSGPITVTCNVQDDKGQTATAQTTVNVEAPPPPPPAPKAKQLCSITFDRDKRRPERVDNEAKA